MTKPEKFEIAFLYDQIKEVKLTQKDIKGMLTDISSQHTSIKQLLESHQNQIKMLTATMFNEPNGLMGKIARFEGAFAAFKWVLGSGCLTAIILSIVNMIWF